MPPPETSPPVPLSLKGEGARLSLSKSREQPGDTMVTTSKAFEREPKKAPDLHLVIDNEREHRCHVAPGKAPRNFEAGSRPAAW